jgi:archaemetzincin
VTVAVPVRILWIGEGIGDAALLEALRHRIAAMAGPTVTVGAPAERPAGAWDARRRQDASGKILDCLAQSAPAGGKLLAITDRDLFIPVLTFVFGEARMGGSVAVVSIARLREERHPDGRRILEERLAKEALHEVGHLFGLRHCRAPGCVMRRSVRPADIDAKSVEPCLPCRERLRDAIAP